MRYRAPRDRPVNTKTLQKHVGRTLRAIQDRIGKSRLRFKAEDMKSLAKVITDKYAALRQSEAGAKMSPEDFGHALCDGIDWGKHGVSRNHEQAVRDTFARFVMASYQPAPTPRSVSPGLKR